MTQTDDVPKLHDPRRRDRGAVSGAGHDTVTSRTGYQGTSGAHSEEALRAFAGKTEPVACRTLIDVFAALEAGATDYAFVPVENSQAGSVVETYDLMVDHDVTVIGEYIHQVSHHLLGVPGGRLREVKRAYSHPQALAQCAPYLRKAGIEAEPYYDTAGAARMVAELGDRRAAAVAGTLAGRQYGLTILAPNIETASDNATRFFLLIRGRWGFEHDYRSDKAGKTSLVFAVPHRPGSLVRALECLARRGVNLTKLESRPSRRQPWEYLFIADLEGYAQHSPLREALDELTQRADSIRVFGSYAVMTTE